MTRFIAVKQDITNRKEAEEALIESEARVRTILKNAVDGIITADERGVIQSFNPAAEKIFAYTQEEVVGQNLTILMPSPYREQHPTYINNYLRTGIQRVIGTGREAIARRKDGRTFPIDLSVSEMRVGGGRMFTGFIRDISERKEFEKQLIEAKEEVLSRVRSQLRIRKLTREVMEKQKQLDNDLKVAAGIQESLLPAGQVTKESALRWAWRFKPCDKIGGDIFNIIPVGDSHYAFYMLDVSGHGVPSALVTVSVSQMLQPHSGLMADPQSGGVFGWDLLSPVEVVNRLDQEYPIERFLDSLMDDLTAFGDGAPPRDDITLLVLDYADTKA